jgi:transposase
MELGKPDAGKPPVRFDEGREPGGHWVQILSLRRLLPTLQSLDPDNVLESATMDKAYDADRIRERLSYDGVQAVIPPIPTRARKLPYDHARYRERNRIERFFNKLKHFRRMATRYDKLAKTFFAALCIVSAFIIIKNS